jgi:XTP/dITP diphosphohydrolase
MDLVIATRNLAKARELAGLLEGIPYRVRALAEFPWVSLPAEGTVSYEENALTKVRTVAAATELLALADDSGLEVDALAGEPGFLSARFGGQGLNDSQRCDLLLEHMRSIPQERRTARFRCVVAVATPAGEARTFEGVVEGRILESPRGAGGFGYDPIFYHPGFRATFAELSPARKHRVSHRALALAKARDLLLTWPESAAGRHHPE